MHTVVIISPIRTSAGNFAKVSAGELSAMIDAVIIEIVVVLARRVGSISQVERYTTKGPITARRDSLEFHDRLTRGRIMFPLIEHFGVTGGTIEVAEDATSDFNIIREQRDEHAAMSHQCVARV